jgi:mutator family transposase
VQRAVRAVSEERVNTRNGYRHRDFDTRVGPLDVATPKLRTGSYFPDWLLQPRRRAEKALVSVVATCYFLGVSTRRMEKLVETLGITRLSRSQVSEMAKSLDEAVAAFRNRPLDAGPYTYVWIDALTQRVREGGRIVNVSALVATGVNGGPPGDPRPGGGHRGGRGELAGVLPLPGGPRAVRGAAGHLRRSPGAEGRDRRQPFRGGVAALPHPLHRD